MSPWRSFELAYVTIELETAFLVGAAESDNLFDSVFVTDASGLPCIPGESLAGALRHALAGESGSKDERVRQAFGFQAREDGESSRIRLSFAHVHGQDDVPVAFRAEVKDDPVLLALVAGVGRDHVRIGKHGAVDQRGKFDELLVPAGARFTFEICLSTESPIKMNELLAMLAHRDLCIGGKTRRGLGRFKVVRVRGASFDLSREDDLKRLAKLPVALEQAAVSGELRRLEMPGPPQRPDFFEGTLTLKPIGTWMIGGGAPTGREPKREKEGPWDRVPLSEHKIAWSKQGDKDRGQVVTGDKAPYLVPGSSIKGALRHRTAFHARRLRRIWTAEAVSEEELLFGDVRGQKSGSPGCVFIGDMYLEPKVTLEPFQHVSLDRFTQAPMDHLLYDELALGVCELKVQISVKLPADDTTLLARKALLAAVQDLCEGRLSIGAGRSHGRFRGQPQWAGRKLVEEELPSAKS